MERAKTATGLEEIRYLAQQRETFANDCAQSTAKPDLTVDAREVSLGNSLSVDLNGCWTLGDIFQLCRPMTSLELDHFLQYLWSKRKRFACVGAN